MKKLLLFLLALALVFSFASCGEKEHVDNDNDGKCDECGEALNEIPPCTEHTDENSDGKCDTCGTAVEGEENEDQGAPLVLIENGIAKFQIVYPVASGSSIRKAIKNFIDDMEDEDIEIESDTDDDAVEADIEVLIGTVAGRDDKYTIDVHTLGEKGYIVKKIDNKIIVLGGSDKALEDAIEAFIDDYIGYKKNKTPKNLTVTEKDDIIEIQDDYRITSVSVNSVDLKGYNIIVLGPDATNDYAKDYDTAANNLQSFLYTKAGYWLPIEKEEGEKSIVIANVEDAGEDGFRVVVRENVLYIECAYNNAFLTSFEEFLASNLSIKQGDIDFASDFSFTKEVSIVRYKDFGAKGNGLDNDFYAIKDAHDYANKGGQKVVADRGTYLITKTEGKKITIKTDTDWTNAKFIFDDRNITDNDPERGANIFHIVSDYVYKEYKPSSAGKPGQVITALNESAKDNGGLVFASGDVPTIDLGLGYPAMITIYNENHYQYIRYGGNANDGGAQHENVIVDENGVVSSDTSILHDFTEITKLVVRRIDDKPVTITGGEFTTRANQCKATYAYFSRNIAITRPNTTIVGIKHYITDEGDDGNPYSGWLNISDTANVLLKDCVLTGHRVYMGPGSVESTPQGTYDTGAGNACNITWKNVTQSNFFHLDKNGNETGILSTVTGPAGYSCWGIMGSNYCKNLTYDGCKLTRIDAHCGTLNATIKDSHVAVVAMIGGGLLTIENSTIYDTFEAVVNLRNDYGSTWNGDLIMKDVTYKVLNNNNIKNGTANIIVAYWYNHDFGYKTYLPQNIVIDNFVVDSAVEVTTVKVISGPASSIDDLNNPTYGMAENLNPMEPTKSITIKNNKAGYTYIHPMESSSAFADTVMTTIPNEED